MMNIGPEIYSADYLLEIADSTNAPDWHSDTYVTFEAKDGWKVEIFYDCGELDYIEHFITPDGQILNFWEWPDQEYRPDQPRDDKFARDRLINWCGVRHADPVTSKIHWLQFPGVHIAYLGTITVTEVRFEDVDGEARWTPKHLFLEGDRYYNEYVFPNLAAARADVEDYVQQWLEAAGILEERAA